MTKTELNENYWQNRYVMHKTGWDLGCISSPLEAYINTLNNESLKILIPGAGNSYEAEYLWKSGFKNVFVLDIAKQPLLNFEKRVPNFPKNQLIHKDFFELNESFDLILEQTFFCALHPSLRTKYIEQMHQILKPKGKLAGLLFNFELSDLGPPYGGSFNEYKTSFGSFFKIKKLEKAYNSIKERQGKELFFIFEKNNNGTH